MIWDIRCSRVLSLRIATNIVSFLNPQWVQGGEVEGCESGDLEEALLFRILSKNCMFLPVTVVLLGWSEGTACILDHLQALHVTYYKGLQALANATVTNVYIQDADRSSHRFAHVSYAHLGAHSQCE